MLKCKKTNFFWIPVLIIDVLLLSILFFISLRALDVAGKNSVMDLELAELGLERGGASPAKSGGRSITDSLQILTGYFVAPDQKVSVIDTLEKMAGQSGILYEFNNALEGDRIRLDIGITGSFSNIYYFISLLENAGYWVTFEKMSLTRGTTENPSAWSGNLQINIPNEIK